MTRRKPKPLCTMECTSEQIAAGFESDLCHTMCCSAPNGACSADGSCSCALGFGPESSLSRCTASTCVAGDEVVLTDDYRSHGDASSGPLSPGEVGTISYTSGSSVHVEDQRGHGWYYDLAALRPHAVIGCSEPTTTCTSRTATCSRRTAGRSRRRSARRAVAKMPCYTTLSAARGRGRRCRRCRRSNR